MSGYAAEDADRNGALSEGANRIQKPFTTISLALAVRAAIDHAE
jgi:hypothetical protein